MVAFVLTIGDELLIGQVVNTNAAWLGERLSLLGVEVGEMVTVGDDAVVMRAALERAWAGSDLIVLTGGLGPTPDDLTRDIVADFFEVPLRTDAAVMGRIEDRFHRRKRPVTDGSRIMALVPDGFEALPNSAGAAPGLWRVFSDDGSRRIVVVLPGPPRELHAIFQQEVVPRLLQEGGLRVIAHRTLLTIGIGESNLQAQIGDVSDLLGPGLGLAYLPHTSGVRLRMTAVGADRADVDARLDALEGRVRGRIARHIFGTGTDLLEAVLGRRLAERGLTIAVAESCTGGLVLNRLTNVAGSSAYVLGGVVAYGNAVKEQALGVDARDLAVHGAVSEPVARQMAQGVRTWLGADIGVATTGIAGPSGGTPEKPVGTVWIAVADAAGEAMRLLHLGKDRVTNKERASTAALDLVRRRLG